MEAVLLFCVMVLFIAVMNSIGGEKYLLFNRIRKILRACRIQKVQSSPEHQHAVAERALRQDPRTVSGTTKHITAEQAREEFSKPTSFSR